MIETVPSMVRRLFLMSNLTPSQETSGHDLSWPFMCVSIMFTKEAGRAGCDTLSTSFFLVHLHVYVFFYVCMFVCLYVCMFVCLYVYMYDLI